MDKPKTTINHLLLLLFFIYFILLTVTGTIACRYAYREKREQILSELDMAFYRMELEYADILDNFWQVYMPVFENDSAMRDIFQIYFSFSASDDLSPLEKKDLTNTLQSMCIRDSRIQWIALSSEHREKNYIFFTGNVGLMPLDDSFPYTREISQQTTTMDVYAAKSIKKGNETIRTFALCGGVPGGMGPGKIIVGYSPASFEQICNFSIRGISSIHYRLTSNGQPLFDSLNEYMENDSGLPAADIRGNISVDGHKLYMRSSQTGNNTSQLSYLLPWNELFRTAGRDAPFLIGIMVLFAVISVWVISFITGLINKELGIIRSGLDAIAGEHPEYRLPTNFSSEELPTIARHINNISSKLSDSVKKAYYFELKQKDAQLAELQASFNPHFLYNTLEMLRSKSLANGDDETSELIAQLASLFRGFINTQTFITLREELAFTSRYLSLLIARYGNNVSVDYDIPSELLDYGIIRNVLQLLIENYFVHGIDTNHSDNLIRLFGESLDEQTMLICVADNGNGMSDEELEELNRKLSEPIRHGEKSYGLKNLNQRIKLFYGPDCSICVQKNSDRGLTISLRLLKLQVSDYEKRKQMLYNNITDSDSG